VLHELIEGERMEGIEVRDSDLERQQRYLAVRL